MDKQAANQCLNDVDRSIVDVWKKLRRPRTNSVQKCVLAHYVSTLAW